MKAHRKGIVPWEAASLETIYPEAIPFTQNNVPMEKDLPRKLNQ